MQEKTWLTLYGGLNRASIRGEAPELVSELQEEWVVTQREEQGQGVKERSTLSSKGLSAADVNTEAHNSSPLGRTCFVGSLQGKTQTIINQGEFKFM